MAGSIGNSKQIRLRTSIRSGVSVADIIRAELKFERRTPHDMMFDFMEAFQIRLGDVSCIDGWWPDGTGEVSDARLDEIVRRAIETRRHAWETL